MDLGNLAQIGSFLMAFSAIVIAFISAGSKHHEEVSLRLDARIDVLEKDVTRIKADLTHAPSRETVHRLENAMAQLQGELKVMAESLRPVARISERLQEFLLEQATRK